MGTLARTSRHASSALAAGAVLTLCAYAATFGWAFSYHHPPGTAVLLATRGMVHVQVWTSPNGKAPLPVKDAVRMSKTGGRLIWAPRYQNAGEWIIVSVPLWLPAGCIAGLLLLRAWKRSNRHREGQCVACGYELAGLTEVGGYLTCPECGLRRDARGMKFEYAGERVGRRSRQRPRWRSAYAPVVLALALLILLLAGWLGIYVPRQVALARELESIAVTNAELDALLALYEGQLAQGLTPATAMAQLSYAYFANPPDDGWGRRIVFWPWTIESPTAVFGSAGPDGVFHTPDDLLRESRKLQVIMEFE